MKLVIDFGLVALIRSTVSGGRETEIRLNWERYLALALSLASEVFMGKSPFDGSIPYMNHVDKT